MTPPGEGPTPKWLLTELTVNLHSLVIISHWSAYLTLQTDMQLTERVGTVAVQILIALVLLQSSSVISMGNGPLFEQWERVIKADTI